jgi:sugar lactone lactonase YvrE
LLAGVAPVEAQVPRISSVAPVQVPIAGGTLVTVRGSGFEGAAVTVDGSPIVATVESSTRIEFTAPAHDNGYALIAVVAAGGSAYAELLYVPPRLDDLPPGYITTIAGVGLYNRIHLPATTANIGPSTVNTDSIGNVYAASANQSLVFRIGAEGLLEPFAGSGGPESGPNGDGGPATQAWITFPRVCVVDGAGHAYIPDARNRIRRVDAQTGIITTIAGTGVAGFSGDGGLAAAAQIDRPTYLAVEPDGTLYFMDFGNARIRRIAPDGTIDTIAGTGTSGSSGDDGPATAAEIEFVIDDSGGLAVDPGKFLYVVEEYAGKVRRIDLQTGIISTFLPRPGDPPLRRPRPVAVDDSGNLFVGLEGRIVEYDLDGHLLATWGDGEPGFSQDGTLVSRMRVVLPTGLALDGTGNVLFTDEAADRIRRINLKNGRLETVAGIAPSTLGVPGPAVGAALNGEGGDMTFLPSGKLLLTDGLDPRIFAIDPAGRISNFGGTGLDGFGAGPGGGRHISTIGAGPGAMVGDGHGGFFACGEGNPYYVDDGGFTYHVAGAGVPGYGGDGGPATEAQLTQPWDVALDGQGNLFIADTNNNRIRRVDAATGIITTVVGGGPLNGFEGYCGGAFCGDDGPALDACLNTPFGVAVDPDGNIFVSDTCNGRIRRVGTDGNVATFVDMSGTGTFNKLLADAYGGLFAQAAGRLWRFLPDGTSWPVAGTGVTGFSGDGGPASVATLSEAGWGAAAVATDAEGNLFLHDSGNNRVRAVRFGALLSPPSPQVAAEQGDGQSTPIGEEFETPLEVVVATESGSLAPGVRVDFTAAAGGATCFFGNGQRTISTLTDRDGKARATCTASPVPGSHQVLATPLASGVNVSFSLTNTAPVYFSMPSYVVSERLPFASIAVKHTGSLPATVEYQTVDGTATSDGGSPDYSSTSGTLTFSARQRTAVFKVPLVNDTLSEGGEKLLLRLDNPTGEGAVLGTQSTAVLTVNDDDRGGTVAFSSTSCSVSEAAGSVTLTVRRTGGLASGVTVGYDTADGTATGAGNADYAPVVAGILSFAASRAAGTTQTLSIPITQDAAGEGAETFTVTLSSPTGGGTLVPDKTVATVTILDDEATVELGATAYEAKETQAKALVTVKRSGPPTNVVTVDYATGGGTAIPGFDYSAASGTLTFTPGVTSRTFVVPLLKDTLVEGDETVGLALTNAQDRTSPGTTVLGGNTSATLTIHDDDAAPRLQFSAPTYKVSETMPRAVVAVKRTADPSHEVHVDYVVLPSGTATGGGIDYTLASPGTLTFLPGVFTQTLQIPIASDLVNEGTETVDLRLQNPVNVTDPGHAALGTLQDATLLITDSGTTVQFSAAAYSAGEAAKGVTLAVRRTGNLSAPSTAQYDVTGGTATGGVDYALAVPGMLTFGPGQSVRTIPIALNPDTVSEGDETIDLALSDPTGAELGTPSQATVTLRDNDSAGRVQFSSTDYSVAEDVTRGLATITVTRTGGASSEATVDYSTADGTAQAGTDYTPTSGTLAFGLGERSKTFAIPVADDAIPSSGAVSVLLTLDAPGNGLALGSPSIAALWIVRR